MVDGTWGWCNMSDTILCLCLQCYADVIVWFNNMLMQQYDAALCWCNNLMKYCGVTRVQGGPWILVFQIFMKPKEMKIHKRIRNGKNRKNFHDPYWVCGISSSPFPLNLFCNNLNGFLKVIFLKKSFLKMSVSHFTYKNLAPD